jgi:membrane protein required for colicin V production
MGDGGNQVEAISPVDVAALAILTLALLRGLFIGLIREVFSLGALAAACIAVRLGAGPAADWMLLHVPLEIGSLTARVLAGGVIAIFVIVVVAGVGRVLRRGARWAGLGFADRVAGGVLGTAEGCLVLVVLMLLGIAVAGRDHPDLADSRALAAFENVERLVQQTRPMPPPAPTPSRNSAV